MTGSESPSTDGPALDLRKGAGDKRPRRRTGFRWPLLILALLALLAGAVFVRNWQAGAKGPEVTAAVVRSAPLLAHWSATGYVEARTAQVSAPQVGRIVAVEAREGDRVRQGQVLARLFAGAEEASTRAQEAAARAAAAEAAAAGATRQEQARVLADRVTQARAELEAALSRLRQARAALERGRNVARANVAGARAQAEAARHQLTDLRNGPRPQELLQAQATLADAEAVARRARIEYQRQVLLLRERAVGRRAVDDAQEALTRAEASVRRARAALELLEEGTRPEEIAAAQARVTAAEQALRAAEAEQAGLDVEERAVEEMAARVRTAEGALAEARSARARLETLRQQERAAQARVAQAGAGVRQARAGLGERNVTAPFAGTVGRRLVDPGDLAVPGQALFSVVEDERPWVEAEVDEQDLAPVRVGQDVTVSMPAHPGRSFRGRVTRIGAEAVPQVEATRTSARIVRVRVSLEPTPPEGRALFKPGMEVDVAGQATLVPRAVLIASDAILRDAEGSYVWVIEGGAARKRRVKTGYMSGRETEVLSGLKAGEQVALTGKEELVEGKEVRVR